tara:strand:- start:826 stop:2418 length:1593 start_codon:yes stop_codon:yes gene_type:complete
MKKYFDKFIQLNKKTIKNYKSNKSVIIVDRGKFASALYSILIATSVNNKYNFNTFVLTSQKENSPIIKFYKSFGISKFIYGFRLKYFYLDIVNIIFSFYEILKVVAFMRDKSLDWFVDNYSYNNIKIGDLVFDSHIRDKHRFINPKKDYLFYSILFRAILKTQRILSLTKKMKIKFIIVSTLSYANNDAIFLRVGLKKKIRVVECHHFHNKNGLLVYNNHHLKYGPRHLHSDKHQYKKFNKLKINSYKLNEFIKMRFKNKIELYHTNNRDIKVANQNKTKISKEFFLKKYAGKRNYEKIILFAPHSFTDAPHAGGFQLGFRDFYAHFVETLDYIKKLNNKKILWVVRPHPLSNYYGEKNIVENYLKEFNLGNVIICPKNISTNNLILICDNVITCKGTIGLEFACAGKISITCGNPPYSNFNICFETNSKKKYFSELKKLNNSNKKLSLSKTKLAKKLLFYFETVIPFSNLKPSQIFHDLFYRINQNKDDKCWKILLDRYKKFDGFKNDKFYYDCNSKIKKIMKNHYIEK